MTNLFDGMAGVLNDVFGAPVIINPGGGAAVVIQGVVRDREVEVADEHGEAVLTAVTTLKALKADVSTLVVGDQVVANGETYEVLYPVPGESPAADRFETFVLRKV